MNKTKIFKALVILEKNNPDLFFFLKDCIIRESKEIKTACVMFHKSEKKFLILINENWLKDFDLFNLAAIIEHELLHVILGHLDVLKDVSIDKRLSNIAQDAIINDLGELLRQRKKLNSDLSKGIFLSDISRDLKEKKILSYYEDLNIYQHDSRQVYDFLKLLPDDKTENYQLTDEHLENSQCPDLLPIDSKESKEILTAIFGESENSQKNLEKLDKIGQGSKDFSVFTDLINRNKRVKLFSKNIFKFLSQSKDQKKKNSIKRPSRRFLSPIGKQKTKLSKIKLCLDVSGSMMNDEIKEKMQKVVLTALNLNYSIDLICGDTRRTYYEKNIKRNFDFSKIGGGGGTELKFFFQDENGQELRENLTYVILTDGYFNQSDIPTNIDKNKILFLSVDKYNKNIFGYNTIII